MTKAATSYIALKALQAQAAVAASQREGLQTLLDTAVKLLLPQI